MSRLVPRLCSCICVLFLAWVPACGGGTGNASDAGGGGADAGTDAGTLDAGAGTDTGSGGDDGGHDAAPGDDAAVTPTDGGGTLATCGGRSGLCAGDEWCDFDAADACGAADGTGVCRARPETCVPATEIVCGCDGTTYESPCEAERGGTDVFASGGCGGADTFACGGGIRCATSTRYCQITTGGAAPGFTSYECQPLPTTCTGGSAAPSCATCFPGDSLCDDGATGEITVTLLAP